MLSRFRITPKRLILLLAILILLTALHFAVAFYYSSVLHNLGLKVGPEEVDYNLTATALSQSLVKLENGPDDGNWMSPGQWGLTWTDDNGIAGNGMIGDITERDDNFIIRHFTLADGTLPNSSPASVSSDIFPNDPYRAFGIPYQKIQYQTPLGQQDAWQFDGDDDTWVIFVHGIRGIPGDGLPALPVLDELGIPALFITYRNDLNQPQDPTGFYQYGLTEWQDIHAAVEYALSQPGAKNVVLIGQSMGGGIVAKFLYESPLAASVIGVVLDSPMLDFDATIDLGGRQRNLPGFVIATGQWLASLRFDLDWDALNYLKDARLLNAPILLIHGENDTTVPIETSNQLAQLRPDLVTYSTYPDTTHADAWNTNLPRFSHELKNFLLQVAK